MPSSLQYILLDAGNQRRLEQIGPYRIIRPSAQAVWSPKNPSLWDKVDAIFSRDKDKDRWTFINNLPSSWQAEVHGIMFDIAPTDFGHIGLFPEHAEQWQWMKEHIKGDSIKVLNLFAYTGGASAFLAKHGAHVCHVDASKATVEWAKENAGINHLKSQPIRWIVDDCIKFLIRETKRGSKYHGILLDPPSFGRGASGQVFKIEDDVKELLYLCREVLCEDPRFVLFSSHTPGFTPLVMHHLLEEHFGDLKGKISFGEMEIPSASGKNLPSGSFARWSYVT